MTDDVAQRCSTTGPHLMRDCGFGPSDGWVGPHMTVSHDAPAPTDDVAALVKSMRAAADEVHYDTVELLALAADALERLAADLAAARADYADAADYHAKVEAERDALRRQVARVRRILEQPMENVDEDALWLAERIDNALNTEEPATPTEEES